MRRRSCAILGFLLALSLSSRDFCGEVAVADEPDFRMSLREILYNRPQPLGPPAPGSTIENPAYKAWASRAPGSMITLCEDVSESVQVNANGLAMRNVNIVEQIYTTTRLIKVTPDDAIIEQTMRIAGPQMNQFLMNAQRETISARLPAARHVNPLRVLQRGLLGQLATSRDRSTTQTVELLGLTFHAKVTRQTITGNNNDIHMTSWTSDEIPGGTLRQIETIKNNNQNESVDIELSGMLDLPLARPTLRSFPPRPPAGPLPEKPKPR